MLKSQDEDVPTILLDRLRDDVRRGINWKSNEKASDYHKRRCQAYEDWAKQVEIYLLTQQQITQQKITEAIAFRRKQNE